jgi:plastocyanin
MRVSSSCVPGLTLALLLAGCAGGGDEHEVHLVIQDHRFEPAEVVVPAGKRVKIVVENRDATPEEFESHSLNAEKIVAPNASITVLVGPLEPGSYEFFGEFNPETATGTLTAR